METILVKVFATALALSQVAARPDAVKTHFDPVTDRAEVVELLGAGCTHLRKEFDIENIDLDDLIETVMTDKQAVEGEIAAFRGIRFDDLHKAYRQICKQEAVERSIIDIDQLIAFYNRAAADLPDHNRLKGLRLPGLATVLDAKGVKFAELFEPDNRRHWVPLSEIPEHVQRAFIAAEDKRFYEHHGVDERSVIRAFMNMLADPDKRQGGSTITQQVAKNLLVGDEVTYERKIREMIIAGRIEKSLSKEEILEIYLNSIYLGRSSWGVELAARSYFGKPARALTLAEGAFLAGLTKGPAYYNPDKYRTRAQERLGYVLTRMKEDAVITAEQMAAAEGERLQFVAYSRVRRTSGFHFVDHVGREAKAMAGIDSLTAHSYVVRSTIQPELQRAAEAALQEGLARYEQNAGRVHFEAAETNLAEMIRRLANEYLPGEVRPAWQRALLQVRLPLYDVHWEPAVVLEKAVIGGGFESIRVGLRDGRVLPLSTFGARTRARLNPYDVVYVQVVDGGRKQGVRVELRSRPTVQGAAVVMETRTGRILAMVGGFSYPLSQLNRVTQSRRQPGSSLKPLTYLAALAHGLQPNTLVMDAPVTFPPINGVNRYTQAKDWWSPRNYDGGYSGMTTLRRALEQSRNLPTARLLNGGIADTPRESLAEICKIAIEMQLYSVCDYYYPFVLGAQPVRPIDLAAFYAAIANEGGRPTPHVIDAIELEGRTVYRSRNRLRFMTSIDRATFFQLRSILQGVVERGTAASRRALAPYIAGKTGTSDEWNDAWFVGFSNDVTIAVWVGYDNAKGKRTLGAGQAGSRVALPIFEQIMQEVWKRYAPPALLAGPSPEAARHLIALPIDVRSGQRINGSRQAFMEYFRLDDTGAIRDTQHILVARQYDGTLGNGISGEFPNFGGLFSPPWGRDNGGLFGGGGFPPAMAPPRPPLDDWRRESDHRYLREPVLPPPDVAPGPGPSERRRPRRVEPGPPWGGRSAF